MIHCIYCGDCVSSACMRTTVVFIRHSIYTLSVAVNKKKSNASMLIITWHQWKWSWETSGRLEQFYCEVGLTSQECIMTEGAIPSLSCFKIIIILDHMPCTSQVSYQILETSTWIAWKNATLATTMRSTFKGHTRERRRRRTRRRGGQWKTVGERDGSQKPSRLTTRSSCESKHTGRANVREHTKTHICTWTQTLTLSHSDIWAKI